MKTVAMAIVLLAVLVAAIVYGVRTWMSMSGVEMGFHGILAIILCVVFVTGLGVGLMRLSYYSHSHGHDDRAAGAQGDDDGTN
jgi:hypothetical protein